MDAKAISAPMTTSIMHVFCLTSVLATGSALMAADGVGPAAPAQAKQVPADVLLFQNRLETGHDL